MRAAKTPTQRKERKMQVWRNREDGDLMKVEDRGNEIYGRGNDFDFSRPNWEEAISQLESWGYELIGEE